MEYVNVLLTATHCGSNGGNFTERERERERCNYWGGTKNKSFSSPIIRGKPTLSFLLKDIRILSFLALWNACFNFIVPDGSFYHSQLFRFLKGISEHEISPRFGCLKCIEHRIITTEERRMKKNIFFK